MGKYSLYRDKNHKYGVCNSKKITSNKNKAGYMFQGRSVDLITTCDDSKALEEICVNLGCESPKIKLVDSAKPKKPRIVQNNLLKKRYTLKPQVDEGYNEADSFNESGFSYEPTECSGDYSEETFSEKDLTGEKLDYFENKSETSDGESILSWTDGGDTSDSSEYSFNVPGNSACDDSELKSKLSRDTKDTKKHLCFYCEKLQSQLARHLILKHANEDEVKNFMFLPPKSHERVEAIAKIRKKGDFKLFTDSKLNNGYIIPSRRPMTEEKAAADNFTACVNCKGIYTKNNLRHHYAACKNDKQTVQGVLKRAKITVGRIHERACKILRQKVLPRMKEDEIYKCIRYDLLIILYGNDLCGRHRKEYMHKLIRANLRLCARFLLHVRKLNPQIVDFSAIYDPAKYYFLIDAIDSFAGVNNTTGHYDKAGNATEMSKHINKIGEIYAGECIINKDPEKQKEIQDFLALCKRGFSNVTNKTAMETLVARQKEKVVVLPTTSDIMRLCQHLDNIISVNYEGLKGKYSYRAWRNLSEATLLRIQVFNRRRPGEAERLLITDLKNVQKITEKDEGFKDLNAEERKAAHEYVRIELRGKLNSIVPILLKNTWHKALKLIVRHRTDAGVDKKNMYVFGIEGREKNSFLSATALMRYYSDECNAINPKALRGTLLRKHVATKCAQFGLSKTKTASVAKFMGHDIKIHENIYKQPVLKTDIIDMSRVLEKAQRVNDDSLNYDISMNTDPSFSESGASQNVSALADSQVDSSTDIDLADNSVQKKAAQRPGLNHTKPFKVQRIPWTKGEVKAFDHYFGAYLKSKTLPSLPKIRLIQKSYNILSTRTAEVIKARINNINRSKEKSNLSTNSDEKIPIRKSEIIERIKIVFRKSIAKNQLPSLSKCLIVKSKDKILTKLSPIKIQKLVKKFLL